MLCAIQGLNHRASYCLTKSLSKGTVKVHVNIVYWENALNPSSVFIAISTTSSTRNNLSCSFSWDKPAIRPGILRCLLHRSVSIGPPWGTLIQSMFWDLTHTKTIKIPSLLPSKITIYCERSDMYKIDHEKGSVFCLLLGSVSWDRMVVSVV